MEKKRIVIMLKKFLIINLILWVTKLMLSGLIKEEPSDTAFTVVLTKENYISAF